MLTWSQQSRIPRWREVLCLPVRPVRPQPPPALPFHPVRALLPEEDRILLVLVGRTMQQCFLHREMDTLSFVVLKSTLSALVDLETWRGCWYR
jgi:hypothetical protein